MALALPQTLTAQAPVQYTLRCEAGTTGLATAGTVLTIQYRVLEAVDAAFFLHAMLLPPYSKLGPNTPASDPQLRRYTLGVTSSYAPSPGGSVQEAIFSMPDWYCSDRKARGGRLILHLRAGNPAGQLPPGFGMELLQIQVQRSPLGSQ